MTRLRIGKDEFRFEEKDRAIAEALSAELPRLRTLGEQVTGYRAPKSILIIITGKPLRLRDCLRVSSLAWGASLLAFAMAWVFASIPLFPDPDTSAIPAGSIFLQQFFISLAIIAGVLWIFMPYLIYRGLSARWPGANGLTVVGGPILLPLILIRWPQHPRDRRYAYLYSRFESEETAAKVIFAHEYGHAIVHAIHKSRHIAPWIDEGFADVFAEWATGHSRWSPQSRDCVEDPEPLRGIRKLLVKQPARYGRLTARYYWEARALAEQGTLQAAIFKSKHYLAQMRPHLRVEKEPGRESVPYQPPSPPPILSNADLNRMKRLRTGPDEILFAEEHQEAAQQAAALLPDIRKKGEGLIGAAGPTSFRVIISPNAPPFKLISGPGGLQSIPRAYLVRMIFALLLACAFALLVLQPPFIISVIATIAGIVLGWHISRRAAERGYLGFIQDQWPVRGGIAFAVRRGALLSIHFPGPQPIPEEAELTFSLSDAAALRRWVAAVYAAYLLQFHGTPTKQYPNWFRFGFCSWFAEMIAGTAYWRPESRLCADGPEPAAAQTIALSPNFEGYYPLMARYYWEVRTLAEQGKLQEALRAPNAALEKLRPRLNRDSH